MKSKVYFAAPLFTKEERSFNSFLTDILSKRYYVYLPQRDGVLLENEARKGKSVAQVKELIFEKDCEAIRDCNIVFAVLNGRTIDEGVCFELGYGFALGKKCWSYKEDWRSLFKYGDNPMIEGAIQHYFKSIDKLVTFISDR